MSENLFGTDGIRNHVGEYPFTNEDLVILGKSLGNWIINKYGNNAKILIGHDTRVSCSWIKSLLKSSLLQFPLNIYDAEIFPTPAIYQFVNKQKLFDCGIVISASHNPYHDNGIKIIDSETGKLTLEDELIISSYMSQKSSLAINYELLGQDTYLIEAVNIYTSYLSSFFQSDFLKNIRIVIDCANGAMSYIAPLVFKKFGADVYVINAKPDGKNINNNCGSTHPHQLQKEVIANNAQVGFAFDGDGDRVVAVNKDGLIKDGDDILAILLNNQNYKRTSTIVSTIMANQGLQEFLKEKGKELIRTPVGDKYVAKELKSNNLLLGGEPSGHIILRDYLNSSDGLFVALRIAETIIETNNWELYSFYKFPQAIINLKIKTKYNLEEEPFFSIINNYKKKIESGRLVIRYSGTESVLRILVEMHDASLSNKIANDISKDLNNAFILKLEGNKNEKFISQNI